MTILCEQQHSSSFREEIKANEEPFEKERALVATLIVYCQKLDPCLTESDGGSPPSPVDEANNLNGVKSCATAAEEVPKNCTIYRKNDEDDILFAGVKKNSNKKGAKKQKVFIFTNSKNELYLNKILSGEEFEA